MDHHTLYDVDRAADRYRVLYPDGDSNGNSDSYAHADTDPTDRYAAAASSEYGGRRSLADANRPADRATSDRSTHRTAAHGVTH